MEKPSIFDFTTALRGQAQLRVWLASVCIAIWLCVIFVLKSPQLYVFLVASVHLTYAVALYVMTHRSRNIWPKWVGYLTAVLDPLILTAWVIVMGQTAVLVVPLFIFTSIGYGMRTGNKAIMRTAQGVAIAGLAIAPLLASYWHDHMLFWVSSLISILMIPGYVAVLMDKLNHAIIFAEQESRAKSDLLARVSHELRTPLGGISNAAELLQAEANTARPKQLAATILTLSGHLLADINDLLDQSKLTLTKIQLKANPINIADQVEVVRAAVETNARKKGIGFSSVIDPRIVDQVVGDAHWLTRLLINLVGNSVKFTEYGSVALNISLLRESPSDYLLRFSIKDSGVGIPQEFQDKIFDPFVQLNTKNLQHPEGTGLGLAISRQVVEVMGGTLRVSSDVGVGSTFWFDLRLPRFLVGQHGFETASDLGASDRHHVFERRRILIVDDNETNRYLLQEILQKEGHSVILADSGEQALDILGSTDQFDLILLDYNLGDIDGSTVLQTYRFGCRNPVPAYFLTADASALTASRLKNTGAVGVLTKPVLAQELRDAIHQSCLSIDARRTLSSAPILSERRDVSPESAELQHLRPVPTVYIDMNVIDKLKQIGTRRDFIKELLERASTDIERNATRILDALDTGNHNGVYDAAHALKGVCMETGAMRLMSLAIGIMRTDSAILTEQKQRLAQNLQESTSKTREALRDVIAEARQVDAHADKNVDYG